MRYAYLSPGPGALFLQGIIALIFWGIILFGIIWFVRYLIRGAKERRLLRMEVSKLAEEVSLIRQQQEKEQQSGEESE